MQRFEATVLSVDILCLCMAVSTGWLSSAFANTHCLSFHLRLWSETQICLKRPLTLLCKWRRGAFCFAFVIICWINQASDSSPACWTVWFQKSTSVYSHLTYMTVESRGCLQYCIWLQPWRQNSEDRVLSYKVLS